MHLTKVLEFFMIYLRILHHKKAVERDFVGHDLWMTQKQWSGRGVRVLYIVGKRKLLADKGTGSVNKFEREA